MWRLDPSPNPMLVSGSPILFSLSHFNTFNTFNIQTNAQLSPNFRSAPGSMAWLPQDPKGQLQACPPRGTREQPAMVTPVTPPMLSYEVQQRWVVAVVAISIGDLLMVSAVLETLCSINRPAERSHPNATLATSLARGFSWRS